MAFQSTTNQYQNSRYIVGAGLDPYPTIQAAINAANAEGGNAVVFIRPGTYTEDLTLYTTVSLEGAEADSVTIIGKHTPPNTGSVTFSRIGFQSATSIISSAAAGSTTLKMVRCRFVVTDGYVYDLVNWTGNLLIRYCQDASDSVTNGIVDNSSGSSPITISYSSVGKGTTKSLTSVGAVSIDSSTIGCPIVLTGAAVNRVYGGSYFSGMITIQDTADLFIANSTISTGAVTALMVTTTTPITLENVVINTTNAIAIDGTGTVNFSEATFVNSKALAGTITEGLTGVVKTGEIYADTILRMNMTGFYSWDALGPYFDDTTLGTFKLLVGGIGYIRGKLVTWVAQDIAGLTSGETWFIYIDSTGTIGKTSSRTEALFVNNIVLFECLYDETPGTKLQHTVKENHPYDYQVSVSNYQHDVIGTVIENYNNGANISAGTSALKISIVGADELADHGLYTDIPAAADVTFKKFYKNAAGKWAQQNATNTFTGFWNNSGTPTALTAGKYAVYRLYVSKDNLNTTDPIYWAVLNTTQFSNATAAATAIANGSISVADGELELLELCQLGYITFGPDSSAGGGTIASITIAKSTLRTTISGGTGSSVASGVTTNTSSFNGILSGADTNVQAALDTIDNWGASTTLHGVLIGEGPGNPIASTAAGTAGQILTSGGALADPIWTTATYPATVATGNILVASGDNVVGIVDAAAATTGYVLTAVNGAAPTFQATAITGIVTLAGDSGTATGSTVTIAGGTNLTSSATAATVTINLDAALTGTTSHVFSNAGYIGTGTTAADTLLLQAYDVDGTAYVPFATLTANNTPTMDLSTDVTINSSYIYRAGGTDVPVADGGTGLSTLTAHALYVGNTTSAPTALAVGATGELLIGNTANDPSWSASPTVTTMNATTFDTNVVAAGVTLSGTTLSADGTDANISINITAKGTGTVVVDELTLTTDLAVSEGGTGASSLTDHSVLLGSGTDAITAIAVGATGELLIGATGADAKWLAAAGADDKVLTSHDGGDPTWETASGGGITWTAITANQTAVVDNGYICNKAGLLELALPTTCAVGKTIRVTGMNTALGVKVTQAANQIIHFGTSTTTTGATGYISSTEIHDSVELVCCVANLEFIMVSCTGNWTIG